MKKPTVVFVLSCMRSGSTWVGYVLGSCRHSAFLGEYYRAWDEELKKPCAWCATQGVEPCSVLGGIDAVPADEAFQFAIQRTGASVLVDISKSIQWASSQIQANPDIDCKLIHLIRDPRGWYASERRRSPLSLELLLDRWSRENRQIASFLDASPVPSFTAFYDELAADPENAFQPVCDFVGSEFHPRALRYWTRPHHGFAANGASSFLLNQGNRLVLTGDDAYYAAHHQGMFMDVRWKTALTAAEVNEIGAHGGVMATLGAYGRTLSPEGIVGRTAPRSGADWWGNTARLAQNALETLYRG